MFLLIAIAVIAAILFVPNVGKFLSLFTEKSVMVGGKAIAVGLDKADTELDKIDCRDAISILEGIGGKTPKKK